MKTAVNIMAMIIVITTGTWLIPQRSEAHNEVSIQVFYNELNPYGTWINNPEWGNVWIPDVGPGFRPYSTNGYWAYSSYGWTWVSGYPWGWAPFHYGRWYFDNSYGWAWVPGTEWGPCWVSWRRCDGYFGWAPLAPGYGVSMFFGWNYNLPATYWVFVPDRYFGHRDLDRYVMIRRENERLYRNSTFIGNIGRDNRTNVRYFSGPEIKSVRAITGRDFKPIMIQRNNHPDPSLTNKNMRNYRPRTEAGPMNRSYQPMHQEFAPYRDRWNSPVSRSGSIRSSGQMQVQRRYPAQTEFRNMPQINRSSRQEFHPQHQDRENHPHR